MSSTNAVVSSRAIAVGQPEIADELLQVQGFRPNPEDWRVDALKAMSVVSKETLQADKIFPIWKGRP